MGIYTADFGSGVAEANLHLSNPWIRQDGATVKLTLWLAKGFGELDPLDLVSYSSGPLSLSLPAARYSRRTARIR